MHSVIVCKRSGASSGMSAAVKALLRVGARTGMPSSRINQTTGSRVTYFPQLPEICRDDGRRFYVSVILFDKERRRRRGHRSVGV